MNCNLYWGELHTHTYCGGTIFGRIEEAVKVARTHLDFWAAAEHCLTAKGFQHKNFSWKKIRSVINKYNTPGKFATFLGYENGWIEHGDYNIYFKDDGPEKADV